MVFAPVSGCPVAGLARHHRAQRAYGDGTSCVHHGQLVISRSSLPPLKVRISLTEVALAWLWRDAIFPPAEKNRPPVKLRTRGAVSATRLTGEALVAPFRVDVPRKMSREDVVPKLRRFCLQALQLTGWQIA